MNRLLAGSLAATTLLAPAWPAGAAAPAAFKARGEVQSLTGGESQESRVSISFKSGKVRVETDSSDVGKSVIVAQKGKNLVSMLDPAQKILVRMKPSALRGASSDDMTQFDTLLDPTGFKAMLQKDGRKVGPGDAVLGHKTTIWERSKKGDTVKVWLADDLDLPLRIEGKSGKGDTFTLKITALELKPRFSKDEFDDTPPGFTEVTAEDDSEAPAAKDR